MWKEKIGLQLYYVLKASEQLLKDTLEGDADNVAAGLDRAHTEVASILTYNDEGSLGAAISLAYYRLSDSGGYA